MKLNQAQLQSYPMALFHQTQSQQLRNPVSLLIKENGFPSKISSVHISFWTLRCRKKTFKHSQNRDLGIHLALRPGSNSPGRTYVARAHASILLPQSLCSAWVGSPSHKFKDAQCPSQTMLVALLLPRPNWGQGGTEHCSAPFRQGKAFIKPTAPQNYLLQLLIPTRRFSLSHHLPALALVPAAVLQELTPDPEVQLGPVPLAGTAVGLGSLGCLSSGIPGARWDRRGFATPQLTENLKNCRNIKALSVTEDEAFVLFNWADLSAWAAVLLTWGLKNVACNI